MNISKRTKNIMSFLAISMVVLSASSGYANNQDKMDQTSVNQTEKALDPKAWEALLNKKIRLRAACNTIINIMFATIPWGLSKIYEPAALYVMPDLSVHAIGHPDNLKCLAYVSLALGAFPAVGLLISKALEGGLNSLVIGCEYITGYDDKSDFGVKAKLLGDDKQFTARVASDYPWSYAFVRTLGNPGRVLISEPAEERARTEMEDL